MRFGWKRAVSHGIRLLYPPRCVCCDRVVAHNQSLCPACAAALPRIEGKACPACGRAIEFCGRTHRFEFERRAAPFYYLDPVRQGIHLFKFREKKKFRRFFRHGKCLRRHPGEIGCGGAGPHCLCSALKTEGTRTRIQ